MIPALLKLVVWLEEINNEEELYKSLKQEESES